MFSTWLAIILLSRTAWESVVVESICVSSTAQQARNPQREQRCWKEAEEIVNRHSARRTASPLPARFDGEKVDRTAIVLKLCIDASGDVVRTIVLTSSGNKAIDGFYKDTLSKWQFKPVIKNGVAVPSVATIAVNWNPA